MLIVKIKADLLWTGPPGINFNEKINELDYNIFGVSKNFVYHQRLRVFKYCRIGSLNAQEGLNIH